MGTAKSRRKKKQARDWLRSQGTELLRVLALVLTPCALRPEDRDGPPRAISSRLTQVPIGARSPQLQTSITGNHHRAASGRPLSIPLQQLAIFVLWVDGTRSSGEYNQ